MSDPTDTDRLRELLANGTPEPWTTSPSKYVAGRYVHQDWPNGPQVLHAATTSSADAELVAAARNALPNLLNRLDAAKAEVAAAFVLAEEWKNWHWETQPNDDSYAAGFFDAVRACADDLRAALQTTSPAPSEEAGAGGVHDGQVG